MCSIRIIIIFVPFPGKRLLTEEVDVSDDNDVVLDKSDNIQYFSIQQDYTFDDETNYFNYEKKNKCQKMWIQKEKF